MNEANWTNLWETNERKVWVNIKDQWIPYSECLYNKINNCCLNQLALYLTDPQASIRKLAEYKLKKLKQEYKC